MSGMVRTRSSDGGAWDLYRPLVPVYREPLYTGGYKMWVSDESWSLQQSPGSRMAAPAVLLLTLGAVRGLPQPQGYWWMGNSGSFGDVADGDIPAEDYSVDDGGVDYDYNSNTDTNNGGYASAGYGPPARPPVTSSEEPARAVNGDPAGDVSSLGQLSNDINERNTNFAGRMLLIDP